MEKFGSLFAISFRAEGMRSSKVHQCAPYKMGRLRLLRVHIPIFRDKGGEIREESFDASTNQPLT